MLWTRHIFDQIYKADVYVCVGNVGDLKKWVKGRDPHADDVARWRDSAAKVVIHEFGNGLNEWFVWFPQWPKSPGPKEFGSVVHECLHLTAQILRDRGLKLVTESEEAYAYYLDVWFAEIVKVLSLYDAERIRKSKRLRVRRLSMRRVRR